MTALTLTFLMNVDCGWFVKLQIPLITSPAFIKIFLRVKGDLRKINTDFINQYDMLEGRVSPCQKVVRDVKTIE